MASTWSEEFSKAVNTLHSLESVWSHAKLEGADTANIERTIQELVSRMTDEELDAYGRVRERAAQAGTGQNTRVFAVDRRDGS